MLFRSTPEAVTNRAPVANAGPDRTVPGIGTAVTLDGRLSSDPDGDRLNFDWTLLPPAGSAATLTSRTSATPAFTPDVRGRYEIRLVVDDGRLPSPADTAVITVGNTPPVADAGPDCVAQVSRSTTLNGRGSRDDDGDPLSFRWALVARPTGSATTIANPDAPTPSFLADKAGTYTAQLTVSDGAASSTDTVTA